MSKPCNCGDPKGHARAVSSAIMDCLTNARFDPPQENYWRSRADALESKFTTAHGRHYSYFIEGVG